MEQVSRPQRVLVLAGPTASGKTAVGVRLAELLGGEIISADSRQVYRGIDIGTAKPTADEQRAIPHHCIDICELPDAYTAGQFARDAGAIIQRLFEDGIQPIVVGGSGLYIQAVTEGIFEGPAADPALRATLEQRCAEEGPDVLWAELVQLDPECAEFVPKTNIPRIVRALEVCLITGEKYSEIRRARMVEPAFDAVQYGLEWNREALYARINSRVTAMLESGLIDEVRGLLEQGAHPQWQSLNTVGYKEVFAYLEGALSLEEMVQQIQQHTRNYAKRQLTWFRNKADLRWIQVETPLDEAETAKRIADSFTVL